MPKLHRTRLIVCVRGRDRCADGELVVQLPCPAQIGLQISDIYTEEPLYVDSVVASCTTGEVTAWCSTVVDEKRRCSSVTRRFVGSWEWLFGDLRKPDDDGEQEGSSPEPPPQDSEQEQAEKEWYDRMAANIIKARNKTPGTG